MLKIAAFLMVVALGQPALAQACEEGAESKAGEVNVTRDERGLMAVWVVKRTDNVGEDSEHFPRPGLELEFKLKPDGAFGDVSGADVPVTRVADERTGKLPPLSSVNVNARFGGSVVSWRGDKAADGGLKLAFTLLKRWPSEMVIDLTPVGGSQVLASATFDFTLRAQAEDLSRKALAKCGG